MYLKFNAIGDAAKILKVITNVSTWTFEKSADWFHVQQDTDKLIVTVDEYLETDDSRKGAITVMAGKAPPATIKLEQFGGDFFVELDFEKSGEVVLNPGQGWILYGEPTNQSAATIALGTTGYMRFEWSQINPSEGVYNWTPIDNAIAAWALRGKQFAFGVMSVNTSGNVYCTPKWVFDKGAKYTMGNGDGGSTERNFYIPVWDDPIYVEECKKFAEALAKRYDGNPNIAFIDIRNYGNYGEMHMIPFTKYTQTLTTQQVQSLLIQPYIDNFKNTKLIKCWGLHFDYRINSSMDKWAVNNGIGLRCDGIMGPNDDGDVLFMATGKLPIVWEFIAGFRSLENNSTFPWDDNKFKNIIKANKPNYIGMGQWGNDAQYMLSKKPDLIREVANLMGFNFSMITARYFNMISVGEALEISLSVENSGVTNMLTDCVVRLVLLDDNDKVVSSFTTDWDAKGIDGGATVDFEANVVFTNTPVAIYKLAIGLYRNKNDSKPTYHLDNKGRTSDGLYVIGALKIK